MKVIESRRPRHLVVRIDRGEELPAALQRALDEAEARAGWITGVGSLEAAEIALVEQHAGGATRPRRIDTPCDVVALTGNVATQEGVGSLRLFATLARETDLGLQLFAGQLHWARAHALELHVTVFDDVPLARVRDDRTGLALLTAQPSVAVAAPATPSTASTGSPGASPIVAPAQPPRTAYASPSAASAAEVTPPAAPVRPPAPVVDHPETYPEVGDRATHFHFGECVIISSDGERIRLRQDRDGRVREVSLTMLRIEPPDVDAEGKRHFRLSRKN